MGACQWVRGLMDVICVGCFPCKLSLWLNVENMIFALYVYVFDGFTCASHLVMWFCNDPDPPPSFVG